MKELLKKIEENGLVIMPTSNSYTLMVNNERDSSDLFVKGKFVKEGNGYKAIVINTNDKSEYEVWVERNEDLYLMEVYSKEKEGLMTKIDVIRFLIGSAA